MDVNEPHPGCLGSRFEEHHYGAASPSKGVITFIHRIWVSVLGWTDEALRRGFTMQ